MDTRQQNALKKAKNFIKLLSCFSLLAAPLLSAVGWGISHDSLSSLFDLNLFHQAKNRAFYLSPTSDPALIFRYFLLPHYFLYASMPLYIASTITITNFTYKIAPWTSFIGAILSIIGSVYFIGVLGAYLSAPLGSVSMTGIIQLSFVLCLLLFVGNILLGISLYRNRVNSKWTSALFILGNSLILTFPGIENWMTLGSLCMLFPMYQLSRRLYEEIDFNR
ncbi:hypothetical protein [Pedobacter insulae]|uniref:Rhomboid family protein n=1 Tax=Pedobacter insulae TaxID=414048 RepID=A0A1I2WX50_9SPHI|nr:hypothetical protein [Pedobacter insulae]SFH05914.1 hypothetical protein SAMN04489864_104355 [Pedobacter insulae]